MESIGNIFDSLSSSQREIVNSLLSSLKNGDLDDRSLHRANKYINTLIRRNKMNKRLSKKYNFFPLNKSKKHVYDFFNTQESQFWTSKELIFDEDRNQFETLPTRVKELFYSIFGFFSPGDGLICENIDEFTRDCDDFAESFFFRFQSAIEVVHAESYGFAIEKILTDRKKKTEIFEMVNELECVKRKAEFMEKYIYSDIHKGLQYIAMATMEGIFFVSLFAIIFYFRDRGYLRGFIFLNEQVKKDETLHRDFYATTSRKYLSDERGFISDELLHSAQSIIREAVEIEIAHIEYILSSPVDSLEEDTLKGLTVENLSGFAKMLGDQICELSGVIPPIYNVEVDLKWMTDMNMSEKSDFYSNRVGNYKHAQISGFLESNGLIEDDEESGSGSGSGSSSVAVKKNLDSKKKRMNF